MKYGVVWIWVIIVLGASIVSAYSHGGPALQARDVTEVQFFLPMAKYWDGVFWSAVGDLDNDNLTQEVIWMNTTYAIAFNVSGVPIWQTALPVPISTPCLGDFDRDGYTDDILDMDSGNAYNRTGRYIPKNQNISKSPHYAKYTSYCPIGAVGDLNHDGYADDIVGSGGVINLLEAYAYGNPSLSYWNFSVESGYQGAQIGDLDNDGFFDDTIVATGNGTYALNETGQMLWWVPYTPFGGGAPFFKTMVITDLDGDHYPSDVLFTTGSALYAVNESGDILWNFSYNPDNSFLALGDTDHNGVEDEVAFTRKSIGSNKLDLIILSGNTHTILWNFTLPTITGDVHFLDLTGCGYRDSVITWSGQYFAFDNLGQLVGCGLGAGSNGLYCGDFDGDGLKDDFLSYIHDLNHPRLESYRFTKLQVQVALLPEVTFWSDNWVGFKLAATSQEPISLLIKYNLTGPLMKWGSQVGSAWVDPGNNTISFSTRMEVGTGNVTVTVFYAGLPFAETTLRVTVNPPIGSSWLGWAAIGIVLLVGWQLIKITSFKKRDG